MRRTFDEDEGVRFLTVRGDLEHCAAKLELIEGCVHPLAPPHIETLQLSELVEKKVLVQSHCGVPKQS